MNASVIDAIESISHTSSEALEIDAILSKSDPGEIPDHKLKSVIDYIDFRSLYKAVPPELRGDLQKLHASLSNRYFAA